VCRAIWPSRVAPTAYRRSCHCRRQRRRRRDRTSGQRRGGLEKCLGRVPDLGLPGGTQKRTVTRLLHRALRHYEIAVSLGPCMRVMRSCQPVLDTGAGANIVRTSVLPANRMAYAERLTTLPRIRDANNNCLVTKYAIHLYVDTGGVRLFDRFLVSDNLSVPCMLGTEFIEQNIEAILPRLRKIVWQ